MTTDRYEFLMNYLSIIALSFLLGFACAKHHEKVEQEKIQIIQTKGEDHESH